MDRQRSSCRSPYRHQDNIEAIDYLEDYIDDEVEREHEDGLAEAEADEAAMEIVPLTPLNGHSNGYEWTPQPKSGATLTLQHLHSTPYERKQLRKATIASATDLPTRSNLFMSNPAPVGGVPASQSRTPLYPLNHGNMMNISKVQQTGVPSAPNSSSFNSLKNQYPFTAASPAAMKKSSPYHDASPDDLSISTVLEPNYAVHNDGESSAFSRSKCPTYMSYRSSTSRSLLYGEVISLDPGGRSSMSKPYACDSDSGSLGRCIPEQIDEIPQFYPVGQDGDIEARPLEGMEIGGGSRQSRNTKHVPTYPNRAPCAGWSVRNYAKWLSRVQQQAMTLSVAVGTEINKAATRASKATQRVWPSYSAEPSPTRSSELDDFNFLQRIHREKIGRLADKVEFDDHFDFVLVLTPQESYRFWSELLDFRLEHLGMEGMSNMDALLESASTHSTESCNSEDLGVQGLQDFVTPKTGIYRRRGRGRSTPPSARTNTRDRNSIANSILSTATKRSQRRLSVFEKAVGYQSPLLKSQLGETSPSPMKDNRPSVSSVRRRWGNHTAGRVGASNILSPPVRSLTRGNAGSVRKLRMNSTPAGGGMDPHVEDTGDAGLHTGTQQGEYFPNPVIPRGIAARTNGLLQFLSALKRGIVLRRHRPNNDPVYCKIFSTDGGDTIQYHLIDSNEAMVAFKEQRVRYNRNLNISSPTAIGRISRDWSFGAASGDGSPVHMFKLPDFIAARRYREKLMREHGITKRFMDFANKAANSGMARAADIVAVHPASHLDPRLPGCRKGEVGTATLRRSRATYLTSHAFSLVTAVGQRFKAGKVNDVDANENKWYSGEGSDLQFKILDFEAATEGEYWLVFRGLLLLHRDAAVGRFAAERRAGIGGGHRRAGDEGEGDEDEKENRLHRDEFVEPVTVGLIERTIVKARKLDDTYMKGAVLPTAVPPPSDYFLGFRSPGTKIWSRLRMAGLDTQRVYAVDPRRVMIKVRCPEDRLTDVAEVLRMKMKTIDGNFAAFREDIAHNFQPRCDPLECPSVYAGTMASLLHSKDRQTIIDFIIGSRIRDSGAELGQTTDVGKLIQFRVPLHMHRKLDALVKVWVFWWKRENWTGRDGRSLAPLQVPVAGQDDDSQSQPCDEDSKDYHKETTRPPNCLIRFFVGLFYQPLDAIEEYFGEQVTFYFAWMQHCASHLLFLAVIGLGVTACQLSTNDFDHPIRPFFAIVVMLWTFVVLINWRKRSNFLAYRWGTMDHIIQETPRPEFFGEYVTDEITKEWVVKYPKWKRWLKYLISFPVSILFTGVAMLLILLVHANRDLQMASYVEYRDKPDDAEPFQFKLSLDSIGKRASIVDIPLTRDLLLDPTFWVVMGALPAMLGLCIPIMNLILMKISVMLNNFENYRTESEYRTHLIIKVFSFRFVSQFGTVYYYAAIALGSKEAIEGSDEAKQAIENGLLRMGTSVLVYTTVAHWWSIFLQVYFFMIVRQVKRYFYRRRLRLELQNIEMEEESIANSTENSEGGLDQRQIRLTNKRLLLDQAQDEIWFEVMNNPHDSFPEYITAVVQFTFVACFSVVLPITPLLCLFNYLLSMRYDAYKLCRGRRRPLAQKTGGIGVWEHLLHIVAVVAVLTNCWLMGFTNADLIWIGQKVGGAGIFAIVVAWEHIMLLIKYVMQTTISPLPRSVQDDIRRKQYHAERLRHKSMRSKKDRRSKIPNVDNPSQLPFYHSAAWKGIDEDSPTSKAYESPDVLRTIPSSSEEDSSCGLYSA